MSVHYCSRVDFRVLGPVTAHDGVTEVEMGGPKQRLVLAMLLAAHGAAVSTDALMEGLWLGALPTTARKTLQGYVHHLRSRIGEALRTEKSGYSLQVRDARVDERRFGAEVAEAQGRLEIDPAAAADQLAGALALWRGNPYADLDDSPVLRPEITRLSEARLAALADRIDADLTLGRHALLIGELESLSVEYPLQERFRAQLMLGLYRTGRHGEALRVYARTRDLLIEEMGIEPSAQLAALEQQILARDPALDLALEVASPGCTRAVRGYELREAISSDASGTLYRGYQRSVGREVAIRVTSEAAANDPQFIARYEADVARVASLDHPNIVYVQDTWREPGRLYQVMRWIEGERLDAHLARARPDRWTALELLEQVGGAVGAAHRAGVVHGNLDVGSVLVSSAGDAYLTDFTVGLPPGDERCDRVALVCLAGVLLFGPESRTVGDGEEWLLELDMTPELRAAFEAALRGDCRPADLAPSLRRALGGDGVTLAAEPAAPRSDIRCPYKGLHAFRAADAGDFFGRDDLVARLGDLVTRRRLVAVVGPSGSGKSSVVKAGLLPALVRRPRPPVVAEMYPGRYPFDALEDALRAVSVREDSIGDALVADERGLLRTLDIVMPADDTELILVIDQFEELFAMVASESMRALFLDSLVAAIEEPASRLRVVITLRADFFDRPLRYADFGAHVEAGLVPVRMPDDAGLAAAIVGPAEEVGIGVEPGLVSEIVRDVADEPGGLPLLQYALTELFERRTHDQLTVEAYRASGGVLGALGSRAESLYGDLNPAGQRAMHQAFLRLVTVDEGAENVRRRVTRADLAALEVDTAALDEGLRRFGAHRLLTFDADPVSRAPTVEVAHEALLRRWDRLRRWVEDERDQLVLRKRLDAALQEWEEASEDAAYLLRGSRLAQFDAWAAGTEMALNSDERAYLQASRDHDEHLARTAAIRRRRVISALAVAAVVAAGFGVFALAQRNQAADEARNAETARLGSEAGFVVERDRQMALLMAVETYRRDPGFEGLSALQRVLVDAGSFLGVLGAGTEYLDVHWVSDDRLIAATATEVHLLDAASGELTVLPVAPTEGPAAILASSPAGDAAVVRADGTTILVDVVDGSIDPFPAAHGSQAAAISPDGTLVALGRADGTIEIVHRQTGERTGPVLANPPRQPDEIELPQGVMLDAPAAGALQGVLGLAFAPDGTRLVSSGGVFLRAWNVEDLSPTGPEIVNSWGPDDFNLAATPARWFWLDPAGPDVLVVAGDTYEVRWRMSTGERVALTTLPVRVRSAVGAPTDAVVLAADGRVVGRDGFVFDVQEAAVTAVATDPERDRLAVATGDGIVTAALDGSRLLARAVPIGGSTRPTLSRDGTVLAAGLVSDGLFDLTTEPPGRLGFDVNVEIAQTAGSSASFELARAPHADVLLWTSTFMEMRNAYDLRSGGYLGDYWGAFVPAWSDDGRLVALTGRAGTTRVEEVESGSILFESPIPMVAADFDTAGNRVLLLDADASARRVDLASGAAVELPDLPGGLAAVGFTPDDSEILVVGGAGAVRVLDAETLALLRELEDADVATVAGPPPVITTDGRWLFSGTDGSARVWDLASGRQLGKPLPTGAGGTPWAIADEELLRVVTPVAGDALVWNLDTATWVDLACRAAGRDMTPAEWATFGPRDSEHRPTCFDR